MTGIGTSLQTVVLNNLWNISKQEADHEDTVRNLWAYGLVRFTDVAISANNITQHCVEVHAVIRQYIIEFMSSEEIVTSSNMDSKSVIKGRIVAFMEYIIHHNQVLQTS